ncbi:MAG: (d)CMP kinase [Pseudomonadales bacterium]|nr:(d)CMP kinase [Pseudomonadales bacterium]MCP5319691.1 (d)CMP kinase [Pseudomonadales bacterium]MCP5338361.1 (d)CMP kinase [Pseudomonadales bacterium]
MRKAREKDAPVVTVDGPSGSGKGTVCRLLARELGWNLLDSGALYRLVGIAARKHEVDFDDHAALEALARHLDVRFRPGAGGGEARVVLEGEDVSAIVRSEQVGALASEVAAVPGVRSALLMRQRAFRIPPGLVADGRDMGTVVFPDATLKVFLTASVSERAQRRYKQLKGKGEAVSLPRLVEEIEARDRRDTERAVAPLRAAPDAVLVDTTGIGITEVFLRLMAEVKGRGMI